MGHEAVIAGPPATAACRRTAYTHHLGGTISFISPGDAARVNLDPCIHKSVERFLDGRRFDVYHLHEPFLGFIGPSFMRLGEGVKVGTFHTWREGPHLPYIAFWPLIQYWNRLLDGRVAVSESARKTIARYVPGQLRDHPQRRRLRSLRRADAPSAARRGRSADGALRRPHRGAQGHPLPARGLQDGQGEAQGRAPRHRRRRRPAGWRTRSWPRRWAWRTSTSRATSSPTTCPSYYQRAERLRFAFDRERELRHHPAGGDGGRHARRSPRRSTAPHPGRGRRHRPDRAAQGPAMPWPTAILRLLEDRPMADGNGRARPRARSSVRLGSCRREAAELLRRAGRLSPDQLPLSAASSAASARISRPTPATRMPMRPSRM